MVKKLTGKKYFAQLVATVAVVTIVLAGFLTRNNPFSSLSENKSNSPTPIEVQFPIDDVNDGVYTNYKYGYKFEYPEDIFEQTTSSNDGGEWIYRIKDSSGSDLEFLKLSIGQDVSTYRWFYEKLYSLETGESLIDKSTVTKLGSENFEEYKLVTFTNTPLPDSQTDIGVNYTGAWLMNNNLTVTVSLYTIPSNKNLLISNKNIFDQIVASFELTK